MYLYIFAINDDIFCALFAISIPHPNQEQLVISGHERLVLVQRLCNEVSEVFIDGTFKCSAKSVLKCTIYMDYALDIMYLFGFVLSPRKLIYHSIWSATVCNSYPMGCPPVGGDNRRA